MTVSKKIDPWKKRSKKEELSPVTCIDSGDEARSLMQVFKIQSHRTVTASNIPETGSPVSSKALQG
jgi:hypothetical protein